MANDNLQYDVFISYSSKDKAWVRGELLKRLEDGGLRVCIDFRDFRPGAPSVKEIERALLTSRKTLLVLTPDYLASAWTEFEALMLQTLDPANQNLRLIPLVIVGRRIPSPVATSEPDMRLSHSSGSLPHEPIVIQALYCGRLLAHRT